MTMPGYDLFGSIYGRGYTVFQEGEQGDTMYIIQSGAVEVTKTTEGREIVLAQLEQGDFFGEMALIDNKPRSATVRTLCRSRLLPLTKQSLLSRISEDPGIVKHILKAVSNRIVGLDRLRHSLLTESDTPRNPQTSEYSTIAEHAGGDALREESVPEEDMNLKAAFDTIFTLR